MSNDDWIESYKNADSEQRLRLLRNQGRNYLTALNGYAHLLNSKNLNPDDKLYIEKIIENIEKLDLLIEHLTDI